MLLYLYNLLRKSNKIKPDLSVLAAQSVKVLPETTCSILEKKDFHLWLYLWCLPTYPESGLPRCRTCDAVVRVLGQGSQQQVRDGCHGGAFPPKHRRKWLWSIRWGALFSFCRQEAHLQMLLLISFPCWFLCLATRNYSHINKEKHIRQSCKD